MNSSLGQKKTSPGLESLWELADSSERQFSRKQLWVSKLTVPKAGVTLVTVTIILVKPGRLKPSSNSTQFSVLTKIQSFFSQIFIKS